MAPHEGTLCGIQHHQYLRWDARVGPHAWPCLMHVCVVAGKLFVEHPAMVQLYREQGVPDDRLIRRRTSAVCAWLVLG